MRGPGYRVVCNRDEQRERPPAAPPRWHPLSGARPGRALWPIDTQAGGTWIAAAEHGLTLCLLNLNPDVPPDLSAVPGLVSRGMVIPALIGQADAPSAVKALNRLTLGRFAPFRLLAVDFPWDAAATGPAGARVIEAAWDRRRVEIRQHHAGPVCLASSGLGDTRVQGRVSLFRQMLGESGSTAAMQDQFHDHVWPERPEISVRMSRPEARTVSVTALEVEPEVLQHGRFRVTMAYRPLPAAEAVPAIA